MTKAADTLFEPAPLHGPIPDWLKMARDVTEYIKEKAEHYKPVLPQYALDRSRPAGSLTLEDAMRLYHEHGHRKFFITAIGRHTKTLETVTWDGNIDWYKYEDGKAPRLTGPCNYSIRDLNLVPNTYTQHYMFSGESEARVYMQTI